MSSFGIKFYCDWPIEKSEILWRGHSNTALFKSTSFRQCVRGLRNTEFRYHKYNLYTLECLNLAFMNNAVGSILDELRQLLGYCA